MTARSKYWCDTCESVVYADDVHSCYDAKAVRDQQERERALHDPLAKYVRWSRYPEPVQGETTRWYDAEAMAADLRRMIPVVEAAEAWYIGKSFTENSLLLNIARAVRRYREGA